MRTVRGWLLCVMALTPFLFAASASRTPAAAGGLVMVLSREGPTISRLTDGDTVSLRVTLPEKVSQADSIDLVLDKDTHPVASCTIPSGEATGKVTLAIRRSQAQVMLRPALAGLYGINVTAAGVAMDGAPIERSAFLAFEAQPELARGLPAAVWVGAALGLILVAVLAALVIRRRRQRVR